MAGLSDIVLAVDRHMSGPFSWKRDHCAAAVGRVLRDLGYEVPEELFFRSYTGPADWRRHWGATLSEAAERASLTLPWPEIDPAEARGADVGISGDTLAVRCGPWWVAKSEHGYALLPRVERAWRPM